MGRKFNNIQALIYSSNHPLEEIEISKPNMIIKKLYIKGKKKDKYFPIF